MCYENRDAAYAAVCKERDELKRDNKRLNEAYEAMSRDLERMSNQLAETRKRGLWEHLEVGWFDLWRCTACGDEWTFEYDPTDEDTKVNYCPNCGARMDGE